MLWYGKQGVKKLALTNYQRAAYLKEKLEQVKGFSSFTSATCFNEFVVKVSEPMAQLQQRFLAAGIVSGLDLGRYFPELRQHLLVTVTETKSLEQLDRYRALAGRERGWQLIKRSSKSRRKINEPTAFPKKQLSSSASCLRKSC